MSASATSTIRLAIRTLPENFDRSRIVTVIETIEQELYAGGVYAAHGLGADRAALMNRLGSLEAKGVPLGLHSDFNMAPIDPFYLAWIAANRLTLKGNLKALEERLTLAKALRAITIEAAQVIGMDHLVGSVAPGKMADFAVLDQDPFKTGGKELRDIHVEHVIFEGRAI